MGIVFWNNSSAIETDNDLSQLAFESLLAHERGFTLDKLDFHGRLIIFQAASKSRDLSRLIFTQWISQSGYELVDILRLYNLLLSNVSNYVEHLFIWRILCQLINEEDDDNTNIHPDFHEFISYFYRLIKSSVNKKLSSIEEFIICQYASILSTFDMLDIYRR
ncbi:unnamed protein product, partial [Rotaria sp. Silwood2]